MNRTKQQQTNDNGKERALLAKAADAALLWYAENARELPWRKEPTPYRIWLSEIIFQQTRIEAGTAYYLRFLEEAPDVSALAGMEEEKLLKLWEGLGYYSRARNLQKAAKRVTAEYGGVLPDDPEELAKLPGIGPYTAGAIASIAYGKPVPAVDGNVQRVFARLFARKDDIASPETKRTLEQQLAAFYADYFAEDTTSGDANGASGGEKNGAGTPINGGTAGTDDPSSGRSPGDLNQAWMDLGATVCLPNGEPRCGICPFESFCLAHANGLETALPVKAKPKERTCEERTVFVIRCRFSVRGETSPQTMFYLRKRPAGGLLAGLWELPGEPGFLTEAEAKQRIETGYVPCSVETTVTALPDAKHVFSHIEWRMKGYLIDVTTPCTEYEADRTAHPHILCTEGSGDASAVWASPGEIASDYSVPSAFRAYKPFLTDKKF